MASDDIWPRPCLVDGERRAVCWGIYQLSWTHGAAVTVGGFAAGQESMPTMLVEYEDGNFADMRPERVTVLDSDRLFNQFAFEETNDE